MLLRRFSRSLTWALPLALCAGLLLQPDAAAQAAKNGLLLCGNLIVPALFPFFILSSLLISTGGAARFGRLLSGVMGIWFHQPGTSASALVLGFLGGYPVGAKTVCTLYEEKLCDRTQAEHLLLFCNNAGPAFILGAAGNAVFHSAAIGFLLLAIQIFSALLVGVLFRPARGDTAPTQAPTNALRPFSRCLTESVQQAASATVNVCAFVIFFNVVLRLLDCCGLFSLCRRLLAFCHCPDAWQLPLLSGVLELSNGVALLSGTVDGLIPAAFLLSWGGCSVHCQTLTCLTQHDLNLRPYFLGKLFQGCVSAALACLALRFLPLAQRTLNPTQLPLEQPLTGAFGVPLAVSCWLVLGMWALDRWFSGKSTGKRQKKRV